MPLSACYIVKNEEKNLPRSIESIRNVVSEIIVVDTGSTDSTVEVAKKIGARVEFFDWTGDFSTARNFAISKASNEIVVFLDADEWFEPALSKKSVDAVTKIFAADPLLGSIMIPINNLNSAGSVMVVNPTPRILRKNDALGYQGRIHEYYSRRDGKPLKAIISNDLKIMHSGYIEEKMPEKMLRNIELLEASAKDSPDALERHLAHCYLVREYYQAKDLNSSAEHLKAVLAEPDMIRRQCLSLGEGFAALTYNMLQTANEKRDCFSRAELKRKLIEPFKKYIPNHPGAATIDLFFNCLFAPDDNVLLKNIGPSLEAARKLPPSTANFHIKAESVINRFAAQALQRRGRLVDAMDAALASFRDIDDLNPTALKILLGCLHGQPPEEIILFLNSQFDVNVPQRLDFLCNGTYIYGFKSVYAYYLNKKISASMATADEFLSIFLVLGSYGDAVTESLKLLAEKGEDARGLVAEKIFLAAILSGDENIYRDNAAMLEDYAQILDAFYAGGKIAEPSDRELGLISALYEQAAFCGGIECAEKLLGLLGDKFALPVFRLIVRYCAANGLYEHAFTRSHPATIDVPSTSALIECYLFSGRYDEAFELISGLLRGGYADYFLLQCLSAVVERSQPLTQLKAKPLYEVYMQLFDRFIDLRDVVNTEYAYDETDKKRARTLKSLTPAQLNKLREAKAALPPLLGLAEMSEKAGKIYERNGLHANAAECEMMAQAILGR